MFKQAVLGLMALALVACSTPRVRDDYDKNLNLADYHTVRVESVISDLRDGGKAFQNPLNEQRLRDAVSREFAARGLQTSSETQGEDCYATIALGTRTTPQPESRVRVGFGFGTWRPGFGSSVYVMDDPWTYYREGRITVDLYDAKTKKALWHASVEDDLTYMTRDNAAKRINKIVAAMFAKFPATAIPTSPKN